MDKVRLDKWLWSVRIFKSRSLAAEACRRNRVKLKGKILKPSHLVQVGDLLNVQKGGFNLTFELVKVIDKRISAPLASECYIDLTPEEEWHKYDDWYVGKSGTESRPRGAGRPTKKERRTLDDYKER